MGIKIKEVLKESEEAIKVVYIIFDDNCLCDVEKKIAIIKVEHMPDLSDMVTIEKLLYDNIGIR